MSLPPTAAPNNCTSKQPGCKSALGTPTVRKRLGSEPSTPGSSTPKRSGSKPKRTSGQPARTTGKANKANVS
jgi:hypothetical protein